MTPARPSRRPRAPPARWRHPPAARGNGRRWTDGDVVAARLPGPGMNAQRLADRIAGMSGGRLAIQLYAAGELVPALQVFDAVDAGAAEMGHSASFYWAGKVKAAPFFTTVPFGLTPTEHVAWIEHGGGQALWDELYAPFDLKPFMAGNSGVQMGGWFRREIARAGGFRGLKLRSAGLGGELFQRLGAVTVALGVPDIYPALQSGTIDAVEFLGPASDLAAGFYQTAKLYYWPDLHQAERDRANAWSGGRPGRRLPADLRAIVANACAAENAYTLAEADARNGEALAALVGEHGVSLRRWPEPVVAAARQAAAGSAGRLRHRWRHRPAHPGIYLAALQPHRAVVAGVGRSLSGRSRR